MKFKVARTPEELKNGLMNQTNFLPLLFIFPRSQVYAMHMKNMKSNIDIFWITSRGVVVQVYRNVEPSDVSLYPSRRPVRYAIESKPGVLPFEAGDIIMDVLKEYI